MDAQSAAAEFRENRKIAAGLSRFYNTKSVFLSRNRQILCVFAGDLQKNAAVGPAFVCLSSGVQEAWTETENGGYFFLVAHLVAKGLQGPFILCIHRNIAKHSKVIARTNSTEMRLQDGRDIQTSVNCRNVFFIGIKLNATGLKKRYFGR